ncbi:minor capsid protein [Lacrimispora sp.]|uniref:minor capsid protein n=1 Tax=Lacrimispora sp. TaxID=2719234 RepID=UPI0028AF7A46|nr:minor capsid protein [Lacrimispora sp.]
MTLTDVKDFLKSKVECPCWYIGKINGNDKQCIGIYPTQGPDRPIPIGGLKNKSYDTKAVSVLVHWGIDAVSAEAKAQELYDLLYGKCGLIGDNEVFLFDMRTDSPVSVGTDSKGIYEHVINFVIYYKKGI